MSASLAHTLYERARTRHHETLEHYPWVHEWLEEVLGSVLLDRVIEDDGMDQVEKIGAMKLAARMRESLRGVRDKCPDRAKQAAERDMKTLLPSERIAARVANKQTI